ncbi:MAG: hypothetical protein GIW95_07195 [Candidatus Eremiobacteraeota bacterium]|nr:hypothetical protein [Candidatus Eremiobacteraeota bacterium]
MPFLFGAFPVALAVIALGSITLRTLRREGTAGLPTLAIAAWIAIPNPYPWYALWVVPAASLGLPGTAAFALWAATISGLLRYLPEAYGTMGYSASAALTIAQYAPLALVPLVRELHRRSKKA